MWSTISRALPLLALALVAWGGDSGDPSGPGTEGVSPTAGCSGGDLASGALYQQEPLYGAKVASAGAARLLTQRTVERYGHCNFAQAEVDAAFGTLVQQVSAAAAVHP